ncbi:MAG: hydrogen peroxide-inducible genes activator, partial [Deltaproteobacteria bacterium]|nr:hydrogen peroxide-inducible genes activator [Deltaproteobacteria bacterium]
VLELCAQGQGLTLVPKMATEGRSFKQLRFIPFKQPRPKRTIGALWRLTYGLKESEKLLLTLIKSLFD